MAACAAGWGEPRVLRAGMAEFAPLPPGPRNGVQGWWGGAWRIGGGRRSRRACAFMGCGRRRPELDPAQARFDLYPHDDGGLPERPSASSIGRACWEYSQLMVLAKKGSARLEVARRYHRQRRSGTQSPARCISLQETMTARERSESHEMCRGATVRTHLQRDKLTVGALGGGGRMAHAVRGVLERGSVPGTAELE